MWTYRNLLSIAIATAFLGVKSTVPGIAETRSGIVPVPVIGHLQGITSVSFSHNGALIVSGSEDTTIKLWDVRTGRLIRTFRGHSKTVNTAVLSVDSTWLLSGSDDGTVKLWEAGTGAVLHTFRADASVNIVAFSPDGGSVMSGDWSTDDNKGHILVWNRKTGATLQKISVPGGVWWAAFSNDGSRVVSTTVDGILNLWDVHSGRNLLSRKAIVGMVGYLSDGRIYVAGQEDLLLFDATTLDLLRSIHIKSPDPGPIGNNGRAVSIASDTGEIVLGVLQSVAKFDGSGRLLSTFGDHASYVTALAIAPDGKSVLSGSDDNTLELSDLRTGQTIRTFAGPERAINSFSVSLDGARALLETWDRSLQVWDISEGRLLLNTKAAHSADTMIEGPYDTSAPSLLSPDGRRILKAAPDGLRTLVEAETGKEIKTFEGTNEQTKVDFSPLGSFLAIDKGDGQILVFDTARGAKKRTFEGSTKKVAAPFSADGRYFLLWSSNDFLELRETERWQLVRKIDPGKKMKLSLVTLSPDGTLVVGADQHQALEVYDSRSHGMPKTVPTRGQAIDWMLVSPDNDHVATIVGHSVQLWQLSNGNMLRQIVSPDNQQVGAIFSPDGSRLLAARGGVAELLNTASGKVENIVDSLWPNYIEKPTVAGAFVSQCECLLLASDDGTIKLLDIPKDRILLSFVDTRVNK